MERRDFVNCLLSLSAALSAPVTWLFRAREQPATCVADQDDQELLAGELKTPADCVQLTMTVWRDGEPQTELCSFPLNTPDLPFRCMAALHWGMQRTGLQDR